MSTGRNYRTEKPAYKVGQQSTIVHAVRYPFLPSDFMACYAVAKRQYIQRSGGHMTFDEVLTQVLELLQREKRVSYRALKVRFQLDTTSLKR